MIKQWLIKASAPVCGTDTVYLAYSESNPLEKYDIEEYIIDDLWDMYNYILHLDDEEYDSEEEEQEAYDEAYEEWREGCQIDAEEATDEEVLDVAPGGDIDAIEIVYDERDE